MIGNRYIAGSQAGRNPVDRCFSDRYSREISASVTVAGLNTPEEHVMARDGQLISREAEQHMLYEQALIYAEDMAKIFEQEKQRRRALEKANAELTVEICARRRAEDALLSAHRDLEEKVKQRTRDLSKTNKRLQEEIARRKNSEERTRASLEEKEILLAEIHHRVKNNLQIISSLLALQAGLVEDRSVRGVLEDSRNRIHSIAMIHEHIYRSNDLAKIDFHQYIHSLASSLLKNHGESAVRISVEKGDSPIFLRMDKALPCSLIVNELVTNCLKHAFPQGAAGEIRIRFRHSQSEGYSLTVEDNGKGFPNDLDFRSTKSLGLQLVVNLAEVQLQGSIELWPGEGTEFRIRFPEVRKARKA